MVFVTMDAVVVVIVIMSIGGMTVSMITTFTLAMVINFAAPQVHTHQGPNPYGRGCYPTPTKTDP